MFLTFSSLATLDPQIYYITNVFPGIMWVPSHTHLGCTQNVPAMVPVVYLGRYIPTQSQLTMLVLVLVLFTVDVRVDVGASLQWGLELWLRWKSGLGLMLELKLRLCCGWVGVMLELGWSWVGVMLRLVDVRLELCQGWVDVRSGLC